MPEEIGDIGDFEVVPGATQIGNLGFQVAQNRFMFTGESDGTPPEPPAGDNGEEDTETELGDGAQAQEGGEEPPEGEEEVGEEDDEQGQPPEPGTLEDKYLDAKVTLKDGSQVSVREAIQGYYRQDHFTRVMQDVRAREREFESGLQQLEAWKERNADLEKLGRTLQANPQLVHALQQAAIELQQQGQFTVPPEPQPPPQQNPEFQNFQLAILSREWKRELAEIKAQYPDTDDAMLWEALPYHRGEDGIPSMWEAFKAIYFDKVRDTAKRQGRNQAVRQMKKGAAQPTSMKPGAAGAASGKKQYKGSTPAERAYEQFKHS